ncbi:MAG: hypothetical protein LBG22_01565 [Treponema sp.]|nr:hypothetical protein [Treponema sp.]
MKDDIPSSVFNVSIIILIVLNITAIIAASFNDFAAAYAVPLHQFEIFSVVVFSIEYLLWVWTSPYKYPE